MPDSQQILELQAQVLKTLRYSAVYAHALSVWQLWIRLQSNQAVSWDTFAVVVRSMIKNNIIVQKNRLLGLKDQNYDFKNERKIDWQPEVCTMVSVLSSCPWIEAIFVTGSVGAGQWDDRQADVDVMVVTSAHRVWLSRLWVLLATSQMGKRRSWRADRERQPVDAGKWCLNLWLDTDHLALPHQRWGVYTAYEVLQAWCVFDTATIAHQWLIRNKWVKKVLPHWYAAKCMDPYRLWIGSDLNVGGGMGSGAGRPANLVRRWRGGAPRLIRDILQSCLNPWLTMANVVVFVLQFLYMVPHRRKELVSLSQAWFHPDGIRR